MMELVSGMHARQGTEVGKGVHRGVLYYPAGFEQERWDSPEPPAELLERLRHPALRAVVGHFHFGLHRHVERPCRYVTMLRDPVDRMLSLHRHMQRHYHLDMGLEEFISSPPMREADNGQTRRLAGRLSPIGQCTGEDAELAVQHLEQIAVAGITGRFDLSLLLFGHALGWEQGPRVYYPRNVEPERPGRTNLPTHVLELLRSRQEHDVRLFAAAQRRLDRQVDALPPSFADELAAFRREQRRFADGLTDQARKFITILDERR